MRKVACLRHRDSLVNDMGLVKHGLGLSNVFCCTMDTAPRKHEAGTIGRHICVRFSVEIHAHCDIPLGAAETVPAAAQLPSPGGTLV